MSRVYLQPARNSESAANILKSIDVTVGHEIFEGLSFQEKSRAIEALGEPSFHLWSPKAGDQNEKQWNEMAPGDTVLLFAKGSETLRRFKVQGTFLNEQIGKNVWGPWKKGAVFKHLYSLNEELKCNLTLKGLASILGYKENWKIQGFQKIDPPKSNDILDAFDIRTPKPSSDSLLRLIKKEHVIQTIKRIDNEGHAPFSDSTKFDVVYEGERYPPKALVGLAIRELSEHTLGPSDFSGGVDSHCHKILTKLGFEIEPKPNAFPPTDDPEKLQNQANELYKLNSKRKPKGNHTPQRTKAEQDRFARCPNVISHVLRRAEGVCEGCKEDAPFTKEGGIPYLEVHHVKELGDKGPDIVENAVGICPNCHRECHSGEHRAELTKKLESLLDGIYGVDRLV